MWRQRLTRLFIIALVAALVIGVAKDLMAKQKESFTFSIQPIKKKIEDFGEQILGAAVKKLPKAPDLEKIGEEKEETENNQEIESIEEPVQNIQNLVDQLVESVKNLPQDQIKVIKKQIYEKLYEEFSEE